MKKLFLLDAYALIYRAYYAFIRSPRYNSKGMNTSAIFGFTNTLLEILNKERPSHLAVVFDPPSPTFRHIDFPLYKAHRKPTPEDIKLSVPYIKEIIKAFNIPIYEVDGFEADDTIGTLAKKAEKAGFKVFMMTPDKDFTQVVSENIFMYKPRRSGITEEIIDVERVKEWFSVKDPLQVIDILGLMGDAADNIPGAPGIGEKTAKKLIIKYGSIENIIANSSKLVGKQKKAIEENIEQILKSKELATIVLDVPVELNESDLLIVDGDEDKLHKIFTDLEFRNLLQRYSGSKETKNIPSVPKPENVIQGDLFSQNVNIETTESSINTIKDINVDYKLVDTKEKLSELINKLSKEKEICFDTETTSLNAINAELVGISFSYNKNEAYYVNIPKDDTEIINELKSVFSDKNKLFIGQNIKYDILVLKNYGAEIKGSLFDTMIAHYLIEPDLRHNLDYLSEILLKYKPISIEEIIGKKGKNQRNMRDIDIEKIKDYACEDADLTYQLKLILEKELEKQNLKDLFYDIEMPLINVLADMEHYGVSLDTKALNIYAKELNQDLIKIDKEIKELAGLDFNIASPKQLGEVLFERIKIDSKPKKTKTKQYSTSEDVLKKYINTHPIISKILEFRSLKKLISTYVEALPLLINSRTGKIHTSFNQAIAATGRLSSTNPNLQNIPIRTARGREVRKAFIASTENHIFLSADYSQIELRIMAHLSKDRNMIAAFNNNEDIHSSTAAKINNVDLSEVTKEQRSEAKSANFGIIYGISAFGLAENIGISRKQAKELIDSYFKTYPDVKKYMDNSIKIARDNEFVLTIANRKRNLKDINSRNHLIRSIAERNAINAPIQGSAADIIKIAMINIHEELINQGLKSRIILQVHDELNFDVFLPELETIKGIVVDKMENAVKLSVDLTVDIDKGKNWLEAH